MNADWLAQFDRTIALANQALNEEIAEYHAMHGGSALSEPEDVLQNATLCRFYTIVQSLVLLREKVGKQ